MRRRASHTRILCRHDHPAAAEGDTTKGKRQCIDPTPTGTLVPHGTGGLCRVLIPVLPQPALQCHLGHDPTLESLSALLGTWLTPTPDLMACQLPHGGGGGMYPMTH